jgi:GntR family transcriptional repressor for pyruvate dehydrogenase complex
VFIAIRDSDAAAATAAMQSHLNNVRGKLRRLENEEQEP